MVPTTIKIYKRSKKGDHEADKVIPVPSLFGELIYPCDKCDYSPKIKESLKRHIDFVHNGLKLKCDQCSKLYAGEGKLRRHIRREHSNEIRLCDLCDFVAKTTDQLWYHKSKKHFN